MNILGIDFEEWYHPELVKPHIKNIKHNPSVINGIDKILDLLRKHETFATFFVVGELLEIQPDIFDKIIENDPDIQIDGNNIDVKIENKNTISQVS